MEVSTENEVATPYISIENSAASSIRTKQAANFCIIITEEDDDNSVKQPENLHSTDSICATICAQKYEPQNFTSVSFPIDQLDARNPTARAEKYDDLESQFTIPVISRDSSVSILIC